MMEKKDTLPAEKVNTAPPVKVSREPFFGTILFGFMIFSGIVIIGVAIWAIYRGVELNKKQAALPSIADLSQEAVVPDMMIQEESVVEESTPVESQAPQEAALKKAQTTDIKVLNGGASKGSAGILGDLLKKKMFTRVTIGNALNDYLGTVVYYGPEFEKEAGLVRDEMIATYPKTEMRPSVKSNSETSQAPLTIIVGK